MNDGFLFFVSSFWGFFEMNEGFYMFCVCSFMVVVLETCKRFMPVTFGTFFRRLTIIFGVIEWMKEK